MPKLPPPIDGITETKDLVAEESFALFHLGSSPVNSWLDALVKVNQVVECVYSLSSWSAPVKVVRES